MWPWSASTPVPPKNLLPNGRVAPVLCTVCKEQMDGCVCHELMREEDERAINAVENTKHAENIAQEKAVLKEHALQEKWELHCKECGYMSSACMCPTVVGGKESKIRFHTPIPARIAAMIDFCTKLQKTAESPEHKKTFESLVEQGQKLATQHKTLAAHLGCGVVTEQIMDSHSKEVDAWMAACDKFNIMLCKFVSQQLMQGCETPPKDDDDEYTEE